MKPLHIDSAECLCPVCQKTRQARKDGSIWGMVDKNAVTFAACATQIFPAALAELHLIKNKPHLSRLWK